MQVTRSSIDTTRGPPADWFTGDVYVDPVAAPRAARRSPGRRSDPRHGPYRALLDRIDEIVRPGVNINRDDTSYGEQVLQARLRRR